MKLNALKVLGFAATLTVAVWSLAEVLPRDIAIHKTVDNAFPTGPGQTVEFTITAENVGSESVFGVIIEDKLPGGLSLPDVMVPYAGAGNYDPETGRWTLGGLAPGARKFLTIPAIVAVESVPPCIINSARLLTEDDSDYNNTAAVAIHGQGTERCADLEVRWGKPVASSRPCGGTGTVVYNIYIKNQGPDDARNVSLIVSELSTFRLPGLELNATRCSGNVCTWDAMQAGKIYSTSAYSRSFKNNQAREHLLGLEVSTSDYDYIPDNDTNKTPRTIESFAGACPDYGVPEPTIGGVGGGGGGCFIATAAYGTPFDDRITVLRQFRDRWLQRTAPGRHLVQAYYQHSPPVADYIAERPIARSIVRLLLVPVIAVISYPQVAALTIMMLLIVFLLWRYRQSSQV